jgi:hypothetical protein
VWEKEYHALLVAHGKGRQVALLSQLPSLSLDLLSLSAGGSEMQARAMAQLTPPTGREVIAS